MKNGRGALSWCQENAERLSAHRRDGLSPRFRSMNRRKAESGITLLLTLGVLAVLLMMMLSFAITARTERRAAAVNANVIRARMLAESALDRAISQIENQHGNDVYPADRFFRPTSGDWVGRSYLPSINGADTAGIEEGLGVTFEGLAFTPQAELHPAVGWIPRQSTQYVDGEDQAALIGRYAYLIIDESGKLDPGAVVSAEESESDSKGTRTGSSPTEITLADAGISSPDSFRPQAVTVGTAGKMPSDGRWFSVSHMCRALKPSQAEMDVMNDALHPFSSDVERFWRDLNNDGDWDDGEDADRVDISGSMSVPMLYDLFLGPSKTSSGDDCDWLKELGNDSWVQGWKQSAGLSTVEARRIIAAQVTANMIDYADPDSIPTPVYIDSNGDIHLGSSASGVSLLGTEKAWGVSEIVMRVQADLVEDVEPVAGGGDGGGGDGGGGDGGGGDGGDGDGGDGDGGDGDGGDGDGGDDPSCDVAGEININPNNSPHNEFYLTKPDGSQITRDDLHQTAPDYEGAAIWVHVKPKGNGNQNSLTLDGAPYPVQNANTYDIASETMTVHVYNDKRNPQGKAMGHWWIAINATDATIMVNGGGVAGAGMGVRSSGTGIASNGRGHISGGININPSNSSQNEFYLTKPDGTQITRDDLHDYAPDYEGLATWVHVKPKGNGNQNGLMLDGVLFELDNGKIYDIVGSPMAVRLYNDNRHANGRCMGRWWIVIDAQDGVIYEGGAPPDTGGDAGDADSGETALDTDPSTGAEDADDGQSETMVVGVGAALRLRTGFMAEIFYPYEPDAHTFLPPGALLVTYTVKVATATGKTATLSGTESIALDQVKNVDGGTLMYSSAYDNDGWLVIPDALDLTVEPAQDWYTVQSATIEKIVLRYVGGSGTMDLVPAAGDHFCNWSQNGTSTVDQEFIVSARAADPMTNDRGESSADFATFWDVSPDTTSLGEGAESDESDIGVLTSGGYESADFCDAEVKNSGFVRLGELGRVHAVQPMRSLRLWSATAADEQGHDAGILDLFKAGPGSIKRGKVNINSLQSRVLQALFSNATTVNASSAATAVLAKRSAGVVFTNTGEVFGAVAGISGADPAQDDVEEEAVSRLAELITVRRNYFTIIACAQAIKDVANLPYVDRGEQVKAQRNQLDVRHDEQGNVVGYVDRILAEQKIMAVVSRDAFSNKMRIERYEYLSE